MKKKRQSLPILERLYRRTYIPTLENGNHDVSQCWIWQGGTNNAGYGLIRGYKEFKMRTVHRVSFIETYGTTNYNSKLEVLHECGNKLCVNPTHLKLGNSTDRAELQRKYHAYNTMFSDKEFMYPTCTICGVTTYRPHFKRLHMVCESIDKTKYLLQSKQRKPEC